MGAAPPDVEQALCGVCKEAAAQRCEECFDEEEGHLYLCAKDACFDAQHGIRESLRRKHRESLAVWNSKAKWTDKCCATHKDNVLALWCADCACLACMLCCMYGEHKEHKTSLVADAWTGLKAQLLQTGEQLEEENTANRECLQKLTKEQDELASGEGVVGAAKRALDEAQATFTAKVQALHTELDVTAAKWSAEAATEHARLAQHTRTVQDLVDSIRACTDDTEAQRAVLKRVELRAQRHALETTPPVTARPLELPLEALCREVAGLAVNAFPCYGCGVATVDASLPCAECAKSLAAYKAHGLLCQPVKKKVVLLEAVAKEGLSLRHGSEELKADKQVVLAAVLTAGKSLHYASQKLRADKDVVLAAVTQDGIALGYASTELRAHKKIVLVAVAQNRSALKYASKDLQADKDVRDAVGPCRS
eukprot:Rhum_TRINITY_DN15434_c6_g2::Rhum_TRINITY_DN15434_c6_g2_i9::g.156409::m.156409